MPCVDTVVGRYLWIMDRDAQVRAAAIDTAEALQQALDNEEPDHVIAAARCDRDVAEIALDAWENGPEREWLYGRDLH